MVAGLAGFRLAFAVALILPIGPFGWILYQQPGFAATTELIDLVVAAKPLALGISVKHTDVKLIKIPTYEFPQGGFTKVEEVIDRLVVSHTRLDEPLLQSRVVKGGSVCTSPLVPRGRRMIVVKIHKVVGEPPYWPGRRVDLLVALQGSLATTQRTTRLQNIILGEAIPIDPRGARQPVRDPLDVTLLVTDEDADMLTLAGTTGLLQLVFRD